MGHKNIAIYGGGVLGTILYEELVEDAINVVVVIDREKEPDFPYDLEIIQLEHLNESYNIDAIIVTSLLNAFDMCNVEEVIRRKIACDVLSLQWDLIHDIEVLDDMKKCIKHVADSGGKIIFLNHDARTLLRIKNASICEKLLRHVPFNVNPNGGYSEFFFKILTCMVVFAVFARFYPLWIKTL
jgi:hypothetical protein